MSYTALDPLRISPEHWDREDVSQALRHRHIGLLFTLIARYTGASQTKIGIAANMAQTTISHIIHGRQQVTSLEVFERIADGLDMPDHARITLGLAPKAKTATTPAADPSRTSSQARVATPRTGADPAASALTSPFSTGSTTAPEADRQDDAGAVQADAGWADMLRRTVIKGPAIAAALQLVGAVTPRDRDDPLDPDMVRGLLGVAGHYRRAYHTVPASRLLPTALAHLDLVMSLRPATRPDPERVPLVTAAGEMAALAGALLCLDASRHEESAFYFDMAWGAARSVEDIELQTVVLGCRSFALAYGGGDHQAGLECADFARKVGAGGACPQTRGWVAAVASERCASLRDLLGCQQRLDESRSALESSDDRCVVWRGIGGFNADKLRAYEGGDMMRLRRYRDAEAFLDDALDRLDASMYRHRATALLDRAEARLGLGQIDAACADATLSLALVTYVQHTGHLDRIEALTARAVAAGSQAARTLAREVQLTRLDHGLPIRRVAG